MWLLSEVIRRRSEGVCAKGTEVEVQCPSTVTRRALRVSVTGPLPSSIFLTYNTIRVGTHDLELLPALGVLRFFQRHAPAWQGWGGLASFTSRKAPIHMFTLLGYKVWGRWR